MILCFAIRDALTGEYLPERATKNGYTHSEPTREAPPRLFKSERGARQALQCWRKGSWTPTAVVRLDVFGEFDDFTGNISIEPQTGRALRDMRVTMVSLP